MTEQAEIEAQQQLLQARRATLATQLKRIAQSDPEDISGMLIHSVNTGREAIETIKATLRGWGVAVADHADDAASPRPPWPPDPTPFTVPFLRNTGMIGRDAELSQLHSALAGDQPSSRLAGLTGPSGIGKTAIAAEYAYRYRDAYSGGVLWINAAGPLDQAFTQITRRLIPTSAECALDWHLGKLVRHLYDHPNTLLIIDNLADPADLLRPISPRLIPAALPCRLLFTTRRSLGRFSGMTIAPLPERAALQVLLRHPIRRPVGDPSHAEHSAARALCHLLGGLPLALELAGAHLGRYPDTALAAYHGELLGRGALPPDDGPRAGREDPAARYDAAVAAALASQVNRLSSADARLLLCVAGQLPEAAAIPIARLALLAGLSDSDTSSFESLPALQELADTALVERLQAGNVRLHPLVREYAARLIPEDQIAAFRRRCAANLAAAYEDIATLEYHADRRGMDALGDDVIAGIELLAPGFAAATTIKGASAYHVDRSDVAGDGQRLHTLLRLVKHEYHPVRLWKHQRRPALFAQQIHNRAILIGKNDFAERAAAHLARTGQPWLALRWCAYRDGVWGGHSDTVGAVAIMPGGQAAISAGRDKALNLWDIAGGRVLQTVAGLASQVLAIAPTPDGQAAVLALADGSLMYWDIGGDQRPHALAGLAAGARVLDLSADGGTALATSDDNTLTLWDIADGHERCRLAGHTSRVTAAALTPDGRAIVSADHDGDMKLWDLASGQELYSVATHSWGVTALALTPDGRTIVTASNDRMLLIWDLASGQELRALTGHRHWIHTLAVTPDGRSIVSGSYDGTLKLWDLATGKERAIWALDHPWGRAAVTSDSSTIVAGNGNELYCLQVV
jgi:hypothetical protein